MKLEGEFKKHAKYLGPFPWLLFWVGRFVQGRFNKNGPCFVELRQFWNSELSFGHKALHGIAPGFMCELLRTKRERRSVRTAKCKIWGKSLRSHWTIAVVNFFARKTEEKSHRGIHRHSKWFDDKTEL